MDKCHTRGCSNEGAITWPLLGNITLCGRCYDNPPPEYASLVAESRAPPDDFDIPDEFDCEPEPGIWCTAEGEEIPYEDLGDSHLLNIIAMLRRNRPETCYLLHNLKDLEVEASGRGLSI